MGNIVSTADTTSVGAADIHVFKLTVSDYGFALANARTGGVFVAEGSRRAIVPTLLQQAGAGRVHHRRDRGCRHGRHTAARPRCTTSPCSTSSGRCAPATKLLTIDPWREIGVRWIDRAEDSGVTLDNTKRAAFALVSESSATQRGCSWWRRARRTEP